MSPEPRAATPVGVILAGGEGSRMGGRAKGLAHVGGVRIVDRVAIALRGVVDEIMIVSRRPDAAAWIPGVRVLADERPGLGPIGGIATALRATRSDVLVVGWDMPFVTTRQLAPLLHGAPHAPIVLWRCTGEVEPLCGLYRTTALPGLDAAIASGERGLGRTALAMGAELLPADGVAAFFNVNCMDDLARAEEMVPPTSNGCAPALP